MSLLRKAIEDLHFAGEVLPDERMANHTSFHVGGPADLYLIPSSVDDIQKAIEASKHLNAPVFVLGAGANILVADSGIPGIVMDMRELRKCGRTSRGLECGAGLAMSDAASEAATLGLSGLEFIYSMPGSVGGSVWMNARCYGKSLSDVIECVEILDENGNVSRSRPELSEFSYKVSPYQKRSCVILGAAFALEERNRDDILAEMHEHREDREKKGHFGAPSAGSIFKNSRSFGMPTGKLIDTLGLRGSQIGGAKVSDRHANIIINSGGATAGDVLALIEFVEERVRRSYGYELEREVLLVGRWGNSE